VLLGWFSRRALVRGPTFKEGWIAVPGGCHFDLCKGQTPSGLCVHSMPGLAWPGRFHSGHAHPGDTSCPPDGTLHPCIAFQILLVIGLQTPVLLFGAIQFE